MSCGYRIPPPISEFMAVGRGRPTYLEGVRHSYHCHQFMTERPTWQETHPRFRPMLGAGIKKDMDIDEFFSFVLYPVIATPKFDGIRCTTLLDFREPEHRCRPKCRSMDDVPNDHIFKKLTICPPGLDGEIMTYNDQGDLYVHDDGRARPFYQIQSDVMTHMGVPNFKYHVFDFHDFTVKYPHLVPYQDRLKQLEDLRLPDFCIKVPWKLCTSKEELEAYETECVERGHEGICWRHVNSQYKYGRSTLRQQGLIKMKRFETDEAEVVDYYEEMQNNNGATINALGYKQRSTHQVHMTGKGRLGGLVLRSKKFTETFNCGSGFTAQQREDLFKDPESLKGQLWSYKYQRHGTKDRPRIPIILGQRDKRDLS